MSVARKMRVKDSDGSFRTVNLGAEGQYVILDDGRNMEMIAAEVDGVKASVEELAYLGGNLNKTMAAFFNAQATGKIYTTKFPLYATSTSYLGTKTDDNAGLVCKPSTLTVKNTNDYSNIPMFKAIDCNWELDSTDGHIVLKAIDGQTDFARDGSNGQVGVLNAPWYVKTWSESGYWYVSVTDKAYDGYTILPECIGPDKTSYGFMVHSKYVMGRTSDGKPISASGYVPISYSQGQPTPTNISYSGLISFCHGINNFYCGETAMDQFFLQLQFMIKYATLNSQSIFGGCSSYSSQALCSIAGTYPGIVISTSNANSYVVGSTVSVGDCSNSSGYDRYYKETHNLAFSKVIKSIEPLSGDTSNSLITLAEIDGTTIDNITTTTSCRISTMPWISGSCDNVLDMDGVCINGAYKVDNVHPFVLGGIECMVGGYEVLGNVVMDITTDSSSNVVRNVYVCHDATALTTTIATIQSSSDWAKCSATIPGNEAAWKYISECAIDLSNGIMVPTAKNASSATGFCDGCYCDAGTSGQREWLSFGGLGNGALDGLWDLHAHSGVGSAGWNFLSRLSPNGMANPLS